MSFFLRIKHWQLFLLLFVLPIILMWMSMGGALYEVIASAQAGIEPNTEMIFESVKWLPAIALPILLIQVGWYRSVGVLLQKHIPEEIRSREVFFQIILLFYLLYVLGLILWLTSFIDTMRDVVHTGNEEQMLDIVPIVVLMIPLNIFAVLGQLYCFYFVAKTLVMAEKKRPVSFSDYAAEFFLAWFFFIGVWILQPRINKIAASDVS